MSRKNADINSKTKEIEPLKFFKWTTEVNKSYCKSLQCVRGISVETLRPNMATGKNWSHLIWRMHLYR